MFYALVEWLIKKVIVYGWATFIALPNCNDIAVWRFRLLGKRNMQLVVKRYSHNGWLCMTRLYYNDHLLATHKRHISGGYVFNDMGDIVGIA